ncbi:hypothetical protein V2A60_002556 [Cordyceps javanica]|uniref:Kinesin light chain n=1 Tax=Cordyceps javanica TaxID=43265 RepID=A0A545VX37_9HYPO|nr:kinesin light chain [Cordyceps javanica]TQW06280.1 kinesin light chain [Cordyceps javanica]
MAAARAMLDETHQQLPGQANDSNAYILGRVKQHNVVIACLPVSQYGTNDAAKVLTNLIRTFPSVRIALMVGVGGGVPTKADVRLGDIVIGTRVIQHDLGKIVGDRLVQPTAVPKTLHPSIGTAVSSLRSKHELEPYRISSILHERLKDHSEYGHPNLPDRLFQASYAHESPGRGCEECDPSKLIRRDNRKSHDPVVHYGAIASGNQVLRDAIVRDDIAQRLDVLCFEMEAAGLMDVLPCIPVRGICDYSDSHKSKEWQTYAAAVAAAYARELLDVLPVLSVHSDVDSPSGSDLYHKRRQRHFMVPFGRNREFVGRDSIVKQLLTIIPPSANRGDCQRVVIEGLGGVGKTQIALEAVYRLRDEHIDCSVFWVPALDVTSFENAYRAIGRELKIQGIDEDHADVESLVKTALSESVYSWLLVIDNADDAELFSDSSGTVSLSKYLPFCHNGSILFTTRNRQVSTELDISTHNTFTVGEMTRDDSIKMLKQNMTVTSTFDAENANRLLDFLADLPLAIKQASSYMVKTGISIARYVEHCQSSDKKLIKLLSKGFKDRRRYDNSTNPVAATWLISFEHISRESKRAAGYLTYLCFYAEKGIPKALLPPLDVDDADEIEDGMERDEALGILKAYSFISERSDSKTFDMHRLVRLAMRNWLEVEQKLKLCSVSVIQWLVGIFPFPKHENRDLWLNHLPHAQSALNLSDSADTSESKGGLLLKMGVCFDILGKYKGAEEFHRASLQLRARVMGIEHPATLDSMNGLANVLLRQGRCWEAERTHRQAWESRQKLLGQEHPDTLASMNNLALCLVADGKLEKAEQLHRRTLELRRTCLGEEHPETLASMNNLALLLEIGGRYEEAGRMHQDTVALMERFHGREHPNTLISRNNLGNVLQRLGRYRESEDAHRETLGLRQKIFGEQHPDTLASMGNLALLLVSLERYDEAEKLHRQTLKLRQKVLGKEHPDTLASMKNLNSFMQHLSLSSSEIPGERLGTGARYSYNFLPVEPKDTVSESSSTGSVRQPLPQSEAHGAYYSRNYPSEGDSSANQPSSEHLRGFRKSTSPKQPDLHLRESPPDHHIQPNDSTRALSNSIRTSTAASPTVSSQFAEATARLLNPPHMPRDMPPAVPSEPQHFGSGAPDDYVFKYSKCTGKRKALLIGINYYGQRGQLRGCINDVRNMTTYLCMEFDYKREDMIILTDDQQNAMSQPTKQNITRAMHWLVRDAKENDSLFFHYSGHGGQTRDLGGDESDSYNEVIYPVDFRQNGHITDDEMHRIMVHPLCAGVRLTAIFDSCCSGTALSLPYIYSTQGILKEPNLAKEAGTGLLGVISSYSQGDLGSIRDQITSLFKKATAGEGTRNRSLATKTSPADVIVWMGSKDDQTSADTNSEWQAGAVSWAFITSLKKNPCQSHVQLLNSIRDELASRCDQKPQLACSHPLNTDLLFTL